MLGIEMLAALIAVAAPEANTQVLAKSADGYVQCYEPNDETKTCSSIATYKRTSNDTWDNTATVLISAEQFLSLETVTPVRIENGEVCGYLRSEDILRGKLWSKGEMVPDATAAPILAKIAEAMAPMLNKKICTAYVQDETGIIAKAKIDGVAASAPDQHVRWVKPSDGFVVGP